MKAEDMLLAIDNGTQSVRALLFDLRGNLIAKTQVHIEPYYSKHPGWAEHCSVAVSIRLPFSDERALLPWHA